MRSDDSTFLYSMMTGLLSSDRASVSILPACYAPVGNSLATKRQPNTVSRFSSIRVWRSFSAEKLA